MIEERARVVDADVDFADVVAMRHSACGGCQAKSGCGTSVLADWLPKRELRFRLPNTIDVVRGDVVIVGLDENELQRASLLMYALPLAGLLLGAICGDQLASRLGLSMELGAILCGLLGLGGSLYLVRHIASTRGRDGRNGVALLRKIPNQPARVVLDPLRPDGSHTP